MNHTIKCKHGNNNRKYETCWIKYKDFECFLEYTNVKNNLIEYQCFCYNKSYQKTFDEYLKK